ncbi:hypothetical protein, variant [Cryptococcus amylolentus CBS 6039]|uniref:Uncharacterized protein n=1 Tax=Cryptococcus amylolentus CBS 6039 TaxID=1295533 RepID=A0A1E3I607_9TREE|nr:hypothetical protein, variant [Cryptococcus amylolentus CBS 6039]ODN84039.1 hypothetical protein, variant [Cryptococcus amylolentus CBS 6039]
MRGDPLPKACLLRHSHSPQQPTDRIIEQEDSGDDEEGSSGWRWKHNKNNSTICVGPDGRTSQDYLIDWIPENWAAYSDSNDKAKLAATVIYKRLSEKNIKNFNKAKASGVQDRIQKMKKAFDEALAIQKPTGEGVTEDDLARGIETWEAKIKDKCPFFFTLLPSLLVQHIWSSSSCCASTSSRMSLLHHHRLSSCSICWLLQGMWMEEQAWRYEQPELWGFWM